MVINILVWLVVAAMAAMFVWLASRSWRSGRGLGRWLGSFSSGLLALVFVSFFIMGGMGLAKLYLPSNLPAPEIQVNASPEMIARGQHTAEVFCVTCHSPNGEMPLVGGFDLSSDVAFPIGAMISTNLTPAGPLQNYSDGELMRLMRTGIGHDGLPRVAMSAVNIRYMGDDDLMDLIAYLRSLPPIENDTPLPADQLNFLGVVVSGAGLMPSLPPVDGTITAPEKAATAEYGEYLLSYQDCRLCHGPDLMGGKNQFTPNGPSLLSVKYLSEEQFFTMMRTGTRPDGSILQPPMPWETIARMDDTELSAMYQYLLTMPEG